VTRAAEDIARGWLTRLDRETLKEGLQQYYLAHIEYPESLTAVFALPGSDRLPQTDRWGKPWSYRLTGFKTLTGLRSQRYELTSTLLGATSDLATALQREYAHTLDLVPAGVVSGTGAQRTVRFTRGAGSEGPDHTVLLAAGSRLDDILFAYAGTRLLIIADRAYWRALPAPR
jgi:hypothetical protein